MRVADARTDESVLFVVDFVENIIFLVLVRFLWLKTLLVGLSTLYVTRRLFVR